MTAAEAKERLLHSKMPNDAERREYDFVVFHALDKQIPKKPIEKFAFSDDIEAGLCPFCNEGVNEEMNFCSYCGQALDWEVSE